MINVIESGGQLVTSEDLRSYLDVFDYSTACGYGHNMLCGRQRASNYDPFTKAQTDDFLAAHEITYLYDAFGRVTSEETVMPGAWGQYGTDNQLANPELNTEYFYYNNYNLLKQTIHNNVRGDGLSVVNHYAGYGELKKQVENPTGDELMRVDAFNLRGQPKNRVLNNNLNMTSSYTYYPGTGQVRKIINGHNSGSQTFDYSYDAWGNIDSQVLNGTTTETFKYDSLQRLKESSIQNGVSTNTISYGYDNNVGLGNLLSKSDYSTDQKYEQSGNAGPNAITSVALNSGGTLSYAYDLNGNRIEDSLTGTANAGIQATYQYDAFNLLTKSVRPLDNQQISYCYGIDNLRYAKYEDTFDENGVARSEITLYLGPQFEQVVNTITGAIESKFMLTDYLTLNMSTLNNKSRYFTQKDRLGSTTQILDENGNKLHTKGYDAFGKPRNGDNWLALSKPTLKFKDPSQPANSIDITKRGFTDHEHLDAFELIHMNGRMYDFNNGRFLSVDPYIQGDTSQSINPYTYILNNPLSGTDPTGYYRIPDDCNPAEQNCSAASYTIKDMVDDLSGESDNGADRFYMQAVTESKRVGNSLTLADVDGEVSDIGTQVAVSAAHNISFDTGRFSSVQFNSGCEGFDCISQTLSRLSPVTGSKLGDEVMSLWATEHVKAYAEQNPVGLLALCYPNCGVTDYISAGLAVAPLAATRGLGPLRRLPVFASGGSIRNVNVLGGKYNCGNCAIAADATLAGNPASALNGGATFVYEIEAFFGRTFGSLTSASRIEAQMLKAGNGARGVVFGSRGVETGHFFNVLNQKGKISFLDGQTGKVANLKDGFQGFSLLSTN